MNNVITKSAAERNTKTVARLSAVADQAGDAATVLNNTRCWRSVGQSWLHIEYEGGTYEGDGAPAALCSCTVVAGLDRREAIC